MTDECGARIEVEKLLQTRNYVAWIGKECENGDQLVNQKYVQRDAIGQANGMHVYGNTQREIVETIQGFGCVGGNAINCNEDY